MNRLLLDQRRYDLDWLRILAILAVFVFHTSRFFDIDDWSIKNATTYPGLHLWTSFPSHWLMPLIFVISGMSTFYALGTRGASRFLKDRALPAGVKWLIIAMTSFVIVAALYDLLVRRVNLLRFLFGMRPLPKMEVRHVPSSPLESTRS
jgi:peptidoglycan/LPS O-acetylase OafA/YrhL